MSYKKKNKQQQHKIDAFSSSIQAALTSSPAVQVAANPWHPDLKQRSLCEFSLLSVHAESHD